MPVTGTAGGTDPDLTDLVFLDLPLFINNENLFPDLLRRCLTYLSRARVLKDPKENKYVGEQQAISK